MIKTIEGAMRADQGRFCLVVSRWNSYIVESLEKGAIDTLVRHGADEGEPDHRARAGRLRDAGHHRAHRRQGRFDAIIALGAVIRGGTPHFEYVAGECVKGMAQVSLKYALPVAFGVLTVDSIEQAIERAGTKAGNKGAEAAMSALEMVRSAAAVRLMAGPRTEARRLALLALYQWQLSALEPAEIIGHFLDDPDWAAEVGQQLLAEQGDNLDGDEALKPARYDAQLFTELVRGVAAHADDIDDALRPLLDRSVTSLDPVERSILRIGTFELMHSPQLPVGVIINEAINLAKDFGATDGHRYVNGVLDRLARNLRVETRTAGAR
jgi:6,7-dimethyl-8-ribityllumazine synthase